MTIGAGITLKFSAAFGRPVKRLAAQLQGILEHAPLLIAIRDINGRVHSSSVMFRERFGLSPDDLRHKAVTQLLPQPAVQLIRETEGDIFAHGKTLRDEISVDLAGEEHTYLLTRFPIASDERGHVAYLNPIAEQLTGWNNAEAAGRPLAEIFAILDEMTRAMLETRWRRRCARIA
jgi:PAS domain-containing protein